MEANFADRFMPARSLRLILRLLLRERPRYRLIDHLLVLRLFSLAYPLIWRWRRYLFPSFARNHGMGIDVVFK